MWADNQHLQTVFCVHKQIEVFLQIAEVSKLVLTTSMGVFGVLVICHQTVVCYMLAFVQSGSSIGQDFGIWAMPYPQPPEQVWASDASNSFIAVTALTQIIFKGQAFAEHIFENELLALFVATYFAPINTMVLCDNTAVIGAMARRSSRPSLISIATTIL